MSLNWQHYVIVFSGAIAAGAAVWANSGAPHALVGHITMAVCGTISTSFGLTSGSAMPATPAVENKLVPGKLP